MTGNEASHHLSTCVSRWGWPGYRSRRAWRVSRRFRLAMLYRTANQTLQPVIKTGDATLAEGKAVIAGQAVEQGTNHWIRSMVTWMIGSSLVQFAGGSFQQASQQGGDAKKRGAYGARASSQTARQPTASKPTAKG
jgi:hypothetical protein